MAVTRPGPLARKRSIILVASVSRPTRRSIARGASSKRGSGIRGDFHPRDLTRGWPPPRHGEFIEGAPQVRLELGPLVKHAERRYPDDPKGTWELDGLRVTVSTFTDDPSRIEVRVDTPEGRGSFWETLRRNASKPAKRS